MPIRMSFTAACAPLSLLCLVSPVMSQPVTQLPEIRVWASPDPTPENVQIPGITVISGDELRATGASTVNRALGERLGLPLRNDLYNSGNDTLDLRGFGERANENLAIIVDGVKLNNADFTSPALNLVPLAEVEQVEVRRGNQAVLFGEGATGGAIVITTRRSAELGTHGEVAAGMGNLGQRQLQGNLSHTSNEWTLRAGWQKHDADNHRDNASSRLSQASASVGWMRDDTRVRLRAEQARNDARLPGSLTAAEYVANPTQTTRPNDWASFRLNGVGVDLSTALGAWRLSANLASSKRNVEFEYFGQSVFDLRMQQAGFRAERDWTTGAYRHAATIGLVSQRWEREESFSFGFPSTLFMSSRSEDWYLRHLVTHSPSGVSLGAGYRSSQLDRERKNRDGSNRSALRDTPDAWELTLGTPAPLGSARFSVGQSFRAATLDELNPGFATLPLRIQTSRDVETAWLWKQGGVSGEVRLYRHRLSNELFYDSNIFSNTNLPPTTRQGLEADLAYRLDPAWTVSLSLRNGSARFRSGIDKGKDIPLAFTDSLQVRLDWQHAAHQAFVAVQQVSGAAVNQSNQCRTPDYTLLSAGYALKTRAVTWRLSGHNLTNERFFTYAFACSGGQVSNGIYPEPGRRLLLSASYAF